MNKVLRIAGAIVLAWLGLNIAYWIAIAVLAWWTGKSFGYYWP